MILIDDTVVSDNLLNKKFVCQLDKCKGACCIEGDSGAPLTAAEVKSIEKDLPHILPYLPEVHQKGIAEQGFWETDEDGDLVTTCNNRKACHFVYWENDLALCGIEKAFKEGKIKGNKPVSCHLYPIRIKEYSNFTAVNYDEWDICSAACSAGVALNVPVFQFVKEALIRRFGDNWYAQLEEEYEERESGGTA